ncbi:MAG: universal stress protein [Bacteroidota bacterium]|nr:universal stress protein [Bacteroidota bacterium]
MNHIVVPVDLSKNSKEALRYAGRLASIAGAQITIVYCYTLLQKVVSHTAGESDMTTDPEKWILKRVNKLKVKHSGLIINYQIIKDETVTCIQHTVDSTKADLVIMGCQGEHENIETYLGTTSGAIVKTTAIPVLLIPPRFKFKGIDKIVFAAKNTFVRFLGTLEPIIQINQIFKPHVQLLHLGEDQDPMLDQNFTVLQVVNDITRYGNDNFNESISEYLSQHHADLLCVIRRKRGFLEKLLGPTRTPAVKFNVDIPALVLIGEDY